MVPWLSLCFRLSPARVLSPPPTGYFLSPTWRFGKRQCWQEKMDVAFCPAPHQWSQSLAGAQEIYTAGWTEGWGCPRGGGGLVEKEGRRVRGVHGSDDREHPSVGQSLLPHLFRITSEIVSRISFHRTSPTPTYCFRRRRSRAPLPLPPPHRAGSPPR